MTKEHLEVLVKELDGRVAVGFSAYPGVKNVTELADMGVARISVGPAMFRIAMEAAKAAARNMLMGGTLAL
jgi:2-methylisocitrate lyase-like PEP mutase family enzyme